MCVELSKKKNYEHFILLLRACYPLGRPRNEVPFYIRSWSNVHLLFWVEYQVCGTYKYKVAMNVTSG